MPLQPDPICHMLFVALFAIPALAQNNPGPIQGDTNISAIDVPFGGPVQTGRPYSVEQVNERVNTLADGTHITQKLQTTKAYRDSEGRTRREIVPAIAANLPALINPADLTFITISDPVAGYQYMLEPRSHRAMRMSLNLRPVPQAPPRGANAAANPPPQPLPSRPRPETSQESLGTQIIEGILTDGTRTTTVLPVGAVGNDKPITTVREVWRSTYLNMAVLSKTVDPRSGENTERTINISQSEPDPALFQVPDGYTIVDPPQQGANNVP